MAEALPITIGERVMFEMGNTHIAGKVSGVHLLGDETSYDVIIRVHESSLSRPTLLRSNHKRTIFLEKKDPLPVMSTEFDIGDKVVCIKTHTIAGIRNDITIEKGLKAVIVLGSIFGICLKYYEGEQAFNIPIRKNWDKWELAK